MAYYRRFFALLICACLVGTSLVPVFADELDEADSSSADSSTAPEAPDVTEDLSEGEEIAESGGEDVSAAADPDLTQVFIISPDVDVTAFLESPDTYEVYSVESDVLAAAASSGDGFPFYGSAWVHGTVSGLGDVSLYFPSNRQSGYVGLDSSGNLFNVSDSTWTGVMYDSSGTAYTVSFGSFALPRYRVSASSSSYQTLYLVPSESNLVLPDSPSAVYSISDLLPFVGLLLLGGILLCCMRKS